jgi:hypothetical protein
MVIAGVVMPGPWPGIRRGTCMITQRGRSREFKKFPLYKFGVLPNSFPTTPAQGWQREPQGTLCQTSGWVSRVLQRITMLWGYSSVGRAFEWHSKGQEFESPYLHQDKAPVYTGALSFLRCFFLGLERPSGCYLPTICLPWRADSPTMSGRV